MQPSSLKFTKMHGLGNDFIVLDAELNPELFDLNGECTLTKSQISYLGNRNTGIGCDQILLIKPSNFKGADIDYFIYNNDGSKASYCGNGARCIVKYLLEKDKNKTHITLNTYGQLTHGHITTDNLVRINIGNPEFDPKKSGYMLSTKIANSYTLDHNGSISFGIVGIGNPHAVVQFDHQDQLLNNRRLEAIANLLQQPSIFSDGVNVNFFVIKEPTHIKMRTYERGCGFTQACGSGACAVASYIIKNNLTHSHTLKLSQIGGDVIITWDKINELIMTGDATHVYTGIISIC